LTDTSADCSGIGKLDRNSFGFPADQYSGEAGHLPVMVTPASPREGLRLARGRQTSAIAKLDQCAVPKADPGFDAATRRTHNPLGSMRRVRDQTLQQFLSLGAVTVSIELDVPIGR
jgi:hypothetical protein